MESWKTTIEKLITQPLLHAKFLNTISLMEYIGARKIIKSQLEEQIDMDMLAHMSEEIRHAQIFKKLALKLSLGELTSYEDRHLLVPNEARAYMQGIDRLGERLLIKRDSFKNYLLTTYIVEKRAQAIYPWYEKQMANLGLQGYLKAIVREETNHLEQMEKLIEKFGLDKEIIADLFKLEEGLYNNIFEAIKSELSRGYQAIAPQEMRH